MADTIQLFDRIGFERDRSQEDHFILHRIEMNLVAADTIKVIEPKVPSISFDPAVLISRFTSDGVKSKEVYDADVAEIREQWKNDPEFREKVRNALRALNRKQHTKRSQPSNQSERSETT